MANSNDWLPGRLPEQAVLFENVNAKIVPYGATLGLTGPQVDAIQRLCVEFDVAYSYTEQCRATINAVVDWRDQIFKGPAGAPAPDPPAFPINPNMPMNSTLGMLAQFRDLRDIILAAPGYTDAIGQDLMLIRSSSGGGTNIPIEDQTPVIKTHAGSGYEVSISGLMHGMDAMRVEYLRNNDGNTWNLVGFLTKTPGVVIISPHVPGEPEAGRIRARYIQSNVPVGNYSQEAAVTVSA